MKNKIIKVLNTSPRSFKWIAKTLEVPREKNRLLSKEIDTLVQQGDIFVTKEREYIKPKFLMNITDEIRITSKGFGFVSIPDGDSVFVGPNSKKTAFDGDTVELKVFADPIKAGSFIGAVTKIVKRKKQLIVGVVKKFGNSFGLEPIDEKLRVNRFRFKDDNKLQEDYVVKAKIIEFKEGFTTLELVLTIGHKDDAKVDIQSIIEESGISFEWSESVVNESNDIVETIDNEPKEDRADLRERLIVTIDGDDTKDFDDAIEVYKNEKGNYVLGVHIADVTHYVKEGSQIDNEAKLRGTSVYLADRVIPMLPEKLSNGICSLNPHVDRFTLSCEMEIDENGKTIDYKIFPSIINSKHRLTYDEVNDFYNNKKTIKDNQLSNMLTLALELTEKLRKFKVKEGYIDFEIEESKLILDKETGKTIDIIPRPRAESEMMIEDFMVRANETVAYHAQKKEVPFIYRVHDQPDQEKIIGLQQVIKTLGININIPQNPEPEEFAKAINELKKIRFDDFMKIMMLRTMAKAIYQKENIGHFGLASKHYTHFTSPIRRYPDLMVHRMLREYFFNGKLDLTEHFNQILDSISKESSLSEQKAMELERKVADIKKAEYYTKFIGKKLVGQIVSMQKFGFFVEFPDKVDGLVHITTLTDGQYELNPNGLQLVSKERKFTIGEMVEVIVCKTSKSEGKIDLVMSDLINKQKTKPRRSSNVKGNRKK